MWLIIYLLIFLRLVAAQNTAINVADVPQCARDCLSNSTVVATGCTSLNVACLCKSPEFVSTFYCCLSTQCKTSEQATAITFNQQQCAAVNTTAPDFVGCSPLKASLTSTRSTTSTTQHSSPGLLSTVGGFVTEAGSYSMSNKVTATFNGAAILTGSCTAPVFALVTASNYPVLFPEIGCSLNRRDCCPFDVSTNAAITKCPQDYFTTASACCPSGYQVYSIGIGLETPCYSLATTTLIPATTPSISGLIVITNQVFSRKYTLVQPQVNASLSSSSIAAICVVISTLLATTAALFLWMKRRNKSQNLGVGQEKTSFPTEEPVLPPQQDVTTPQELASPEIMGFKSPVRSFWPMNGLSSPPAYEKDAPLTVRKNSSPHELPGDTYINEHHPAFGRSASVTELSAVEVSPETPIKSPLGSTTGSPSVTPVPEDGTRTMSPGVVSPLGSPRIPRTITDQSIVSGRE